MGDGQTKVAEEDEVGEYGSWLLNLRKASTE